jgi:hypothetical protein
MNPFSRSQLALLIEKVKEFQKWIMAEAKADRKML